MVDVKQPGFFGRGKISMPQMPHINPDTLLYELQTNWGPRGFEVYKTALIGADVVLKKTGWTGIALKIKQGPTGTEILWNPFSPSVFVRLLAMGLIPLLIVKANSWNPLCRDFEAYVRSSQYFGGMMMQGGMAPQLGMGQQMMGQQMGQPMMGQPMGNASGPGQPMGQPGGYPGAPGQPMGGPPMGQPGGYPGAPGQPMGGPPMGGPPMGGPPMGGPPAGPPPGGGFAQPQMGQAGTVMMGQSPIAGGIPGAPGYPPVGPGGPHGGGHPMS